MLFLIYTLVMPILIMDAGAVDMLYLDNDTTLQTTSSQMNIELFLTYPTDRRIEYEIALNFSYFTTNSRIIQIYLKMSKTPPKNQGDLNNLPAVQLNILTILPT